MDIDNKLLAALITKGLISEKLAGELKIASLNSAQSPTDLIIEKNLVSEPDLLAVKSEILKIPYITLEGKGISPEILNLIPEPVARKFKLIPFDLDKKNQKLYVAMSNPLDLPLIEFLEQKSGKSIFPHLAGSAEIAQKIEEAYSQGLAIEVSEALRSTDVSAKPKTIEAKQLGQIIKEAPIAKIVSTILEYAIKSRASDVHIEPQEGRTRVRYRIDGILHEKLILPRSVHDAVTSRIKILSDMKIDERRLPQDGRFSFKWEENEIDLRVSTLPTVHGEKVVMRLLKKTGGIPALGELGFRGPSLKNLETAITKPHGIILITGPTGSGKTTTLYSVLSKLNTNNVNIITLEDPVEYEIPGINQVQINPQAGLSFSSGLRSFLRQDPNIILVGEIRDRETTALAIQAALTGHLVFSTLHTNNAATAIPRLMDMEAEPFLLVSVLNAVGAQRIVRRICINCRESFKPEGNVMEDIRNILGPLMPPQEKETLLYRGKGCKTCNDTGYLGRIGIFETVNISPAISALILRRSSAEEIEKKAKEEGMIAMKQDGYLKALEGITTLEEVLRVAEE